MQVPGHLVSMYVATCGQNGPNLGSDEKEIILLVYVIIDAATTKIVGVQQYLVRPQGFFGKDRPLESSSPPTTIGALTNSSLSSSSSSSSSTGGGGGGGGIITQQHSALNALVGGAGATTQAATGATTTIAINSSGATSPTATTPAGTVSITEAQAVQAINSELPISLAQAAGKPLNEVIEQFDSYVRSLSIDPESMNFRIVTDGQLPIRQCLHPEACAKDIELPSYYCRFSDLRKEFVRFKSQDLSRALVPVKDIKKLPQMPSLPPLPLSIADIIKELDLTTYDDPEFYVKESRDMVSVIQALLNAGHKFEANEIVNLTLEPGICSIDDEIDGSCIVRARGLPWQSSDQDIAKFFRGLNVAKGGVALCLSALGRRNGEALVRFISQEHRDMALKRHKHHIGPRYIEVYRASGVDFLAVAGGASNEAQAFLSKGAPVIIRMRGLPYDCTAKQVLDFFTAGENPCSVLDGNDGVLFVKKPDGRATGDAFVLFANESDAPKALSRHRESIGQRYIELFRSTTAEVQQVLNRSMDPKTYEPQQPPLIAQIPTVSMQLLPQHVITSGTTKNCIRLRGLPYEARVEHILHFLDEFAKNIIYQGVHMVFNAQGQPSGEAFIQMDSEEAARLCAQQKHNQFMVFGKKYRYIEVFQCSGDDMNLVLNGGLQSPVNPGKPPLLSPGGTIVAPPFGGYPPFGPPTAIISPPPPPPAPHRTHPAAFYQPFVYWPYPSPPVSPTTYFGHAPPPPPHVAANLPPPQHQATALFPVDFLPATPPTYQHSPTSPTQSTVTAGAVVTTSSSVSHPQYNHPLHLQHSLHSNLLHHHHHHQYHPNQHSPHRHPHPHPNLSSHHHNAGAITIAPTTVQASGYHHPIIATTVASTTAVSALPPSALIGATALPALPVTPSSPLQSPTAIQNLQLSGQQQHHQTQSPSISSSSSSSSSSHHNPHHQQFHQHPIPLAQSPHYNASGTTTYTGSPHLLTIDTNSSTLSGHEKLGPSTAAARMFAPTATTTFALAAAAAAAVAPPALALPGNPVPATGPPGMAANQYVELYIA